MTVQVDTDIGIDKVHEWFSPSSSLHQFIASSLEIVLELIL